MVEDSDGGNAGGAGEANDGRRLKQPVASFTGGTAIDNLSWRLGRQFAARRLEGDAEADADELFDVQPAAKPVAQKRLKPDDASDPMLSIEAVSRMVGLTDVTIYRKMADGTFPAQTHLSARRVGWPKSSIEEWLAGRPKGKQQP